MDGFIALATLALFLFGIGRWFWYRQTCKAIFSKQSDDRSKVAEIQARLDVVNAECLRLQFYALRCAEVRFREHSIALVFGPVYANGFGGYGNDCDHDALFVVADVADNAWYVANADAFKPAFLGTKDAIFWPSVSQLESQLIPFELGSKRSSL